MSSTHLHIYSSTANPVIARVPVHHCPPFRVNSSANAKPSKQRHQHHSQHHSQNCIMTFYASPCGKRCSSPRITCRNWCDATNTPWSTIMIHEMFYLCSFNRQAHRRKHIADQFIRTFACPARRVYTRCEGMIYLPQVTRTRIPRKIKSLRVVASSRFALGGWDGDLGGLPEVAGKNL